MKQKRRQELKNAVLCHIANSIRGELLDWDNLKIWLGFEFKNQQGEDVAEKMVIAEAKRIEKRIAD